ncbi:hypothetical protein CM15mP94_1900 [bacterium]|nr:MAG: hypothetical protein CM15mP94_1900 [bacterium]
MDILKKKQTENFYQKKREKLNYIAGWAFLQKLVVIIIVSIFGSARIKKKTKGTFKFMNCKKNNSK